MVGRRKEVAYSTRLRTSIDKIDVKVVVKFILKLGESIFKAVTSSL